METTLFGGPPEIGNVMKLANGQIGFMGIFAHPLFANMTDIIPAMGFAAAEIMNNKSIWMTRVEREKRKEHLKNLGSPYDGSVSPRSENPPAPVSSDKFHTSQPPSTEYFPTTALRDTVSNPPSPMKEHNKDCHDPPTTSTSQEVRSDDITRNNSEAPSWKLPFVENSDRAIHDIVTAPNEITSTSSGAFPSAQSQSEAQRPQVQTRKSSNTVPRSLQINGPSEAHDQSITSTRTSSDQGVDEERRKSEHRKSDYTPSSLSLLYDDSVPDLPSQQAIPEEEVTKTESFPSPEHNTSVSKHCSFPHRPFSHPPNQSRTLGPMSIRSSTERNSVATSGGQTYSTNYSTALSPSTEATSFLTLESSEEHIDDREHEHENLTCPEDPYYYREKTRPSSLPEVVPYSTTGHAPPPMMRGGDKTKSSMKTSTAMVKEPGQETLSSWDEGDGDKSIRRRISRLRFWKKRSDEDDRL